jgi:hypothetical protein
MGATALICHECLMANDSPEAVTALCRFCFVALCKTHLIELYSDPPSFPQYTCRHRPASGPTPSSGRRATSSPEPATRAERFRAPILSLGLGQA